MEESTDVQNDIEVVKKMEDEHLRLQRQFRVIQTDRQHRTMGVHPQFRSQDLLLKTLAMEYKNLNKDLKIARSGRHKKNDKKMKSGLRRALLLRVESENDCEGGYSIMGEMDDLLQLKAAEMLHLRKLAIANEGELDTRRFQSENRLMSAENKLEAAMLRFNAIQYENKKIREEIEHMLKDRNGTAENKLEAAMLRFNAIQYENKKIREEIEHMLKDRALFNQAWDKMLSALGTGKKFLSDLFESSTLAYDQRDEWCHKLRSIQEKGRMDQMLQVQEMRDLKKAFDHETKTYNFLAKKGVKRVNKKQEKREIVEKRAKEIAAEKTLTEHTQILDEIYDYCGETCYTDIIDNFVKLEFRQFSLYDLLTHYCAENEVLDRNLKKIRQDIEDRRDFNDMNMLQQDKNIAELQSKLEVQKYKTEKLRARSEEQNQFISKLMVKINEMFQMLDCSLEPFQNLLGDKQPTVYTTKLSLLLIAQKIKEYVEVVYYYERFLKRKEVATKGTPTSRLKKYTIRSETPIIFSPVPLNLLVPADPCPSCIESRWLSHVTEVPEKPFQPGEVDRALAMLASDPAYMRSDRVHALADCRATASRRLLATRHAQY